MQSRKNESGLQRYRSSFFDIEIVFLFRGNKKQVCKDVNIFQNPLSFEQYVNVLKNNTLLEITNCDFKSQNHRVFSYKQHKKGLNSFYPKRGVLDDGIHTLPLDL